MAVRIRRTDLTEEQSMMIRSHLCLQPTDANPFMAAKFNLPAKPPVLFYLFNEPYVEVPYTFGAALLQRPVNQDLNHPRADFRFTGELFSHQTEVSQEALQQLQLKGTTTLGVYPGFGKTVVGAFLSAAMGLNVVVLYHREFLGNQWDKTFEDFTNATRWIVGTPMPETFPHVTFCMDSRFHLLPEAFRDRIGTLIVDEAHSFCTPSRIECLLAWHPKYVIAETATLERTDGMHLMIQTICGTHGIFRTSTKQFQVMHIETSIEPEVRSTARGTDWNSLIKSVCYNPTRNQMILSMVQNNPTHKILILCAEVQHVNLLCEALRQMGESVDTMAGNKNSYSDSRVLVGTISKIGTGFDEKTACPDFNGIRINMLILATSIKKAALLEQTVGRVFRSDLPVVCDFVDANPILKRHWNERKKWYVSRNGTIQSIKMVPTTTEEDKTDRITETTQKFIQDKIGSLALK
jgi:superfamily II DNA or RNA helicase